MKEYKIIKCNFVSGLERQINILIAKGWKTVGGVATTDNYVMQAMSKDDSNQGNTGPG